MVRSEARTSTPFLRIVTERSRWIAFIRSRGLSGEDAEDLLQAAYLKAFTKIDSVRSEADLPAWFYRILRNTLIDYFRKANAERRRIEALANELRATEDSAADNPFDSLTVCQCFRARLDELNRRYADLIREIDLEEKPPAAVAAASGQPVGTINVVRHRARRALRKELERFCRECATEGACLDCGCGEKIETGV